MKVVLTKAFPEIKKEFYDFLSGKDDRVLKKFHDEINHQVNEILQANRVPDSIYNDIKARMLEFLNVNALGNNYSLDALKCYLHTLLGTDKEKESLNQVPGEPFALKMNERLALLNISMGNDSSALDNLLCDVFLFNDKLKLKSSEDKNLLCSGMYACLAKEFYDGYIRDSIEKANVERGDTEHWVSLSALVTPYSLQESLSDTSSIDSFYNLVCSEDDDTEVISLADSDDLPPTPEELKLIQDDLSDIDDFPPLPTAEELRLYQQESSEPYEVDSLYGSASDASSGDK